MTPQENLAGAQAARAEAQRRLAAERDKHAEAQAAKARLVRLREENHLAYLFRRAFSGQ